MTHKTGPRRRLVSLLTRDIEAVVAGSGCTVTEASIAMHEVELKLIRRALAPLEKDCPTCPKD